MSTRDSCLRMNMKGFVSGIFNNDDITYCPRCGDEPKTYHGDGTVTCDNCGFHFVVIVCAVGDE